VDYYDNCSDDDDDDDDDDDSSSVLASSDTSDLLFGEKRNYPFSTCVLGAVNDETPVKHNKKQRTAGRILSGDSGDSLVHFLLKPPSLPLVVTATTTAAASSTNPIINPSTITATVETVTATMDDSVDAICAVVDAMESGDNTSSTIPSLRLVCSCSESYDDNEEEEEGANAYGATTLQHPLAQKVVPPQLVCVSNYSVQELHAQLSTCCCHDRDGCSDGSGVYLIPHIICSEDSKLPEELGGLRRRTGKCTSKTAAAFTFTHCNRHREQSTLPESAAAICGSIGGGSCVSRSQRHIPIAATVSDLAVRLDGPRVFLGKGGFGYAVKCQLLIEKSSRQQLFKEYGSTMKRRRDFNDALDRESSGKMSVVLKIDHKQSHLMWEVIVHHQVGFSNITLLTPLFTSDVHKH
jgi:hypothetical protein